MAAKNVKKSQSTNRTGSANKNEAASIAASLGGQDAKKRGVVVWPEWSDADINGEKWDVVAHKGKEKDKGKSPVVQHLFDDPDGKIEFPPNAFKVDCWKRPQDYVTEKTPVIVDPDGQHSFDLMSANEHVHENEVMRWITSQITALWRQSAIKPEDSGPGGILGALTGAPDPTPAPGGAPLEGDHTHSWRPWEHIYAINKVGRGPNIPAYNAHGKYVVKLYWMGCWRKIVIDDMLPFDEDDRLLLPATTMQHELWPMLLTKALIKIASIDYNGGSPSCEFGDFSVIHSLTGWLPETIPLQRLVEEAKQLASAEPTSTKDQQERTSRYGHLQEIWNLLRTSLPEFKLPEAPPEAPAEGEKKTDEAALGDISKEDSKVEKEKEKSAAPTEKTDSKGKEAKKEGKDKDKGKDDKKDKKEKGDKDKDKMKEKSIVQEEIPLPEHPEMIVFAAYSGQPKYPVRISVLGEMADASERLRQSGISHLYPHPVLLTQTRACPLEPPPPPEKVPAWKLIRPRKKKATPSDEPINVEEKKPIQCLEITSPFIHYKVSPVPIPTDVHRPKSSLERGSTRVCSRPGTANVEIIEETDENAPIPDPQPPQILKVESPKPEEPKEELLKETLQLIAAPRGPQDLDSLGRLSSLSVFSDISDTSTSTCVSDKSSEDLSAKSSKTKRSRRGSVLQAAPSPSPLPTTPELDKPVEASSKPTTAKSRKKGSGVTGKQRGSSDSVEGVAPSPKPSLEKKITGQKSAGRRQNSASSRDVKPKGDSQGTAKDTKDMKSTTSSQQGSVVGPFDPVAVLDSVTPTVEGAELAECLVGPDGEPISAAAPDTSEEVEIKSQDIWMDFETFCKCFKTLYIFHKPHTYLCNHKHSDLKTVQLAPGAGSKDKKSAPSTAVSSSDDKSPHYLFVDNLKPTEIVVSFSALCRWNEPPPPPTKEDSKTHIKGKASDRDSKVDALTLDSTSLLEGGTESLLPLEPINQGLLVAEPYSWKSLVIGQPILRLRTTATRAAVLSLPAGRHVLRFNMAAPLGYHIHLTSTVHCVFGDEEKVMAELTKESCRFVDNATHIMVSMGKCIHGFHDPLQLSPALVEFYQIHCPYHTDKHASKQYHYKLFLEAFYLTIRKVLLDGQLATPEMAFAWKVFHFDVTTKNPLALHYSSTSRPATGVTSSDRGSAGGKKAAGGGSNKKQATQPVESTENTAENKVDYWRHKEVTPEEHVAAVKIQRCWRGYYVRKVKTARTPGTELNLKVQETLQKAYSVIEPQSEQIGLQLLRSMFKTDPDLMTKYPFYQDEWNKISYADYQGAYPDQPPNTWFVVFREIFYVAEEMLCVPKLYVPINTCMLRVINNDNGEEVPRVFQKVTPYVYKKNKKGYTFVAEARTTEQPLVSGRWRMRLIGSLSPLPSPSKNEVNCSFHTRELRDYYLPNDTNVILRYTVKVQEDHVVSLQLSTSKHDVYAKLQVMDGQQELYSAMGKGHVVLPAVIFQKDPGNDDGETKRSGSRASNKGGKAHGVSSTKDVSKKRVGSATDGRASRSSTRSRHSIVSVEEDDDMKPHKYIIQATVLRNSWPLSESQWAFVQILKDMEKNELKVANKERAPSPPRSEKAPSQSSKGKDKGAKGKGGKDKDKTSRPPSQQFDITKPNWTLRIVSEGQAAEEVEVKKDVERAEEIRAMKRAWEEAEPGRAAKALQSRLQYLNSHTIKPRSEDDTASTEEPQSEENQTVSPIPPLVTLDSVPDSDTNLTLEPPPAPTPKETLPTVDLTPFLKKTTGTPRLRDDTEIARQMEAKQKEIQAYRAYREEVERCREIDRQQRNQAKIDQLHMCENMQASLDTAREAINAPCEAFRQRFLDAERRRLEEIAAQEANLRAEQEKNAPTPKGRKSAKGKKSPSIGKKKK